VEVYALEGDATHARVFVRDWFKTWARRKNAEGLLVGLREMVVPAEALLVKGRPSFDTPCEGLMEVVAPCGLTVDDELVHLYLRARGAGDVWVFPHELRSVTGAALTAKERHNDAPLE
jgi:hypothetical protein